MRPSCPLALSVRDERRLVNALRNRNVDALGQAFGIYHDPLLRIIAARMDARLRRRLDEDDVLQESYLHAARRLDHFADEWIGADERIGSRRLRFDGSETSRPTSPASRNHSLIFLWLRLVVRQTMIDLYRHHLATAKRDLHREVSTDRGGILVGQNARFVGTSEQRSQPPSQHAVHEELAEQLGNAVARLSECDRRVIALRHDQGHSNTETATALGISAKAASIRYARALTRLKKMMA